MSPRAKRPRCNLVLIKYDRLQPLEAKKYLISFPYRVMNEVQHIYSYKTKKETIKGLKYNKRISGVQVG